MNVGSKLDKFHPTCLEDCLDAPNRNLVIIVQAIMEKESGITELADRLKLGRTTVRSHIEYLMKRKYIHIAYWDGPLPGYKAAIYKPGNLPSAPMPVEKRNAIEAKKLPKPPPPPKPFTTELPQGYLAELGAALVPARTQDEQYETNWAYWNHLARRAA